MVQRFFVFLLLLLLVAGETDPQDYNALTSLTRSWEKWSSNWEGQDPCGEFWEGIACSGSRITAVILPSMNLTGTLSGNIQKLSELQILDLSYNKGLGGMLPPSIGNLKKLQDLVLIGCGFYGPIPDTVGSLQQLTSLSLNSNNFSGQIPNTIGYLSNLYWLDLSENQLEGPIPVSNGSSTPGLDMLVNAKHFHLGNNKLSESIPPRLFSPNMSLLHVLLDSNKLGDRIPDTLGLVTTLEVVRLDRNTLTGVVPSTFNNLTNIKELLLSNNKLSGSIPNLTGMNSLGYVDMSNNSFDSSSFPSWFSDLQSLTTIMMENTQLQGPIPVSLFSLPNLETVVLRENQLSGKLEIGTGYSSHLQLIDLQANSITEPPDVIEGNISLILVDNPVCEGMGETKSYCRVHDSNTSYSVPLTSCKPSLCSSGQISSTNCKCAYPYKGTFLFRSISFSDLNNLSYFMALEEGLLSSFKSNKLPVDSVTLSNPTMDSLAYLNVNVDIFPSGQDRFNQTGVANIAFLLSNQIFKAPEFYGPYAFIGDNYLNFAVTSEPKKSSIRGIVIGAAVGGSILLLCMLLVGFYAFRQKERAKRAIGNNPFAHWDSTKSRGSVPDLKGARWFSFEDVKKCTFNFSEANQIGSGGYGKVYRGCLPTGQLVAIKKAHRESMQGGPEFKNEIELLSRVHHKNLVSLVGFCFDQGEQMLVYEYVPNGTLRDTLSGKSEIRLNWIKRLEISLGAARGIAYLHEFANPPIIHRDIKSSNILLDKHLTAQVADFGLSKIIGDSEKGHVSTQVKGTVGYLDPDYYMTQQLTEKSDVYSFGVVMLEIITGRKPIEQGTYIVREVRTAMDKTKDIYNLYETLDPIIRVEAALKGLEKFVDLAFRCVEESGVDRPTMGEVVKEIENIMLLAGVNPQTESTVTSDTYEEASMGQHPYNTEIFAFSGDFPHPR